MGFPSLRCLRLSELPSLGQEPLQVRWRPPPSTRSALCLTATGGEPHHCLLSHQDRDENNMIGLSKYHSGRKLLIQNTENFPDVPVKILDVDVSHQGPQYSIVAIIMPGL